MHGKYIIAIGLAAIIGIFFVYYDGLILTGSNAIVSFQIEQMTQISGEILLIVGTLLMIIGGLFPNKKATKILFNMK